jgi:outer membrane PBP1 activator LpoA protein
MLKRVAFNREIQYLNLYMTKLIDPRAFLIAVLVCLLCGCTNSTRQAHAGTYAPAHENALQEADKYLRMAGNDKTETAQNYKLRATEQFIAANRIEQAEQLLNHDLNRALNTDNTAYKLILQAQIALSKHDTTAAQQHLSAIWTPLKLPVDLQSKFYSTRSELYRRSGNLIDAVQERIYLSKLLNTSVEQRFNNEHIWGMLSELTPNTLHSLQRGNNKDELNGWISFANITKEYDDSSEQRISALNTWKRDYPGHPALGFMPESSDSESNSRVASYSAGRYKGKTIDKPRKIALMLPLQGSHAQSAQAIRDGFLAAYYAHSNNADKPKIQIYDTTQGGLSNVYQQTVDEGADFVVGPLIKEDVESFNSGSRPQVPVLALNMILESKAQDNVFQFGLSPELEAQAVAEKAWRDGHRNALVIVPKSAWGARMKIAFQEQWHAMGGKILRVEEIQSQTNLNKEIQHLLDIDASEERAKKLKQLGIKFSFEPRRRQDPDMVFIATNAVLARQVKPLLNFYYAAKLPAYASSSIFSGKIQPNLDQDLSGIQFCDMPWILDQSIRSKATYKSVSELWPKEFEQYGRLYALGLDAYKIAMQIDQMTMLPDVGISGMTGMLTMDAQQKVQRRLMWATFRKGYPSLNGEQS